MISRPSQTRASLIVLFSSSLWGLFWIPIRYLDEIGIEGELAVVAFNLPAACLLAFYWLMASNQAKSPCVDVFLVGSLLGASMAFYAVGLVNTTVMKATLFFYLTPVWSSLLGFFWLGEPFRWSRCAALVFGLLGLAILVALEESAGFSRGDFIALLSGIFWALGTAIAKRRPAVDLIQFTSVQFFSTAAIALLMGLLWGKITMPSGQALQQGLPLSLGVSWLLLVPSSLLIFWTSKFLFPGRLGILMMSEVLLASISASLLLPEERLTLLQWGGAILIILAGLIELMPGRVNPSKQSTAAK